ncbi:uncharacterized protein LOC134243645 [Saccostrea cucullata]|uniref:uncharacterized protein LOC134243645 n=1 Tax=Saccostrea cuccullata TaxID=36930 RepID=UPI002ED31DED
MMGPFPSILLFYSILPLFYQGTQSANSTSDAMFVSDEMHTGSHDTTTSTSMQNGTTADLDLNGTLRHVQPSDFQISAVRTPDNKSEMHVGMKMKLKVYVSFPKGYYKEVILTVSQGIHNIDVESQSCVLGRAIQGETSEKTSVNYENTGFLRTHEMSFIIKSANVSFSDIQSDYQLVCNYDIYLHNAVNLTDRQNISIPCLVQVTSPASIVQNFETAAFFIARTSILEMNKTASFGPATPFRIYIEPKVVKEFVFRAWIPYYNPQIKVKLEGDEKFQSDYVALFLEVTKVGKNFSPGADGKNDSACKSRWSTSQQPLIHTFPSQWINRGYYENKNTTDDDLLEFEVLVAMSDTAKRGLYNYYTLTATNYYTLTATITLNDAPVWNTSVDLFVQDPSLNVSSNVSISDVLPCETLPKSRNSSIVLKLEIPDGRADKLDLILLTKKLTGDMQSAVVIENVRYIIETPYPACYKFDVNYFNNSLSIQNKADVTLRYVDRVATSISSKVNLTISADLRIVQEKFTLGDNHEVSAIFGNTTTGLCNITVKDPDIYNDIYGIILSKLHLLLDKENSSCFNLPIKGDNPPLLWMRMQTLVLGISPAPFNVTVRGKGISCQRHGQKLLQVWCKF